MTSLHLTDKYIVVALDNAKIHVFDADGAHQKTLHGHVMGVWAMVPWDDYLVSGGCDRDVRVWNMATGKNVEYKQVSEDAYRAHLPTEVADELMEMLLYQEEFGYYGVETDELVAASAEAATGRPVTFEGFLHANPILLD